MSGRPTCFVIANCTHKPIQAYLSATGLFSNVESMALFSVKRDKFDEAYDRVATFDYIFSIAHGRGWGPFSIDVCKPELGDRLVLFTTPFFNGLHPDVVYVSNGIGRAQSLLGDYHSGLVFWGFMTGKPVEEIIEMYDAAELPAFFDLKNSWSDALKALVDRDRWGDIPSAPIYDQQCREHAAMLTFNHPSMDIIAALCDAFCAKIFGNAARGKFDYRNVYHSLTNDATIPVLPAAIKAHQLPFRPMPNYKLRPKPNEKDVYVPFAEFARMSYEHYAGQNTSNFLATTPSELAERINQALGKA